jgi:hypothetical protein
MLFCVAKTYSTLPFHFTLSLFAPCRGRIKGSGGNLAVLQCSSGLDGLTGQNFTLLHVQTSYGGDSTFFVLRTGWGGGSRHEADHSPLTNAAVKNTWIYIHCILAYCYIRFTTNICSFVHECNTFTLFFINRRRLIENKKWMCYIHGQKNKYSLESIPTPSQMSSCFLV